MSTDDQSWSCTATEVSGAPVETVVHTWSINTPANFVPNVAATTAFDLYVWIQDETDPDYPPFDLAITETLALREGAGADPDAARIYYAGSLEVQP
jgi:hypothetical protein